MDACVRGSVFLSRLHSKGRKLADSSQLDDETPAQLGQPWQVKISSLILFSLVAASFSNNLAWWASGKSFGRDINLTLAAILLATTYAFLRKSRLAYVALTILSLISFLVSGSCVTSSFVFGAELVRPRRISDNTQFLVAIISGVLLYCLLSEATYQFLQTDSTRRRRWQFSIGRLVSWILIAAVFSVFFANSNAWNQIHWEHYVVSENGRPIGFHAFGVKNPFKGSGRVNGVWFCDDSPLSTSLFVHQLPGFVAECDGNTVLRASRIEVTWSDIDEYKTTVVSKQSKLGYDEFIAFVKNRRQAVSASTN